MRVHYNSFRESNSARVRNLANIAKSAASFQILSVKRAKKERMRALKENDMDAYELLLREQKDSRLQVYISKFFAILIVQSLLSQTSEFLATISAMVLKEKNRGSDIQLTLDLSSTTTSADFFNLVHNCNEIITEQPSLLSGGILKPYQIEGLKWMVSLFNGKLNGILADEMGLGKTIQSIALFSYLIEKKNLNGPFLVIVPLSTISNWKNEFQKWAPDIQVVCYLGKQSDRNLLFNSRLKAADFNVVLTTYDYVVHKQEKRLSTIPWEYLVIDEGHRMKNTESKLVMTLQKFECRRRMILTGTPLQNSLNELWALFNFLLPTVFDSADNFDAWFNKPFESAGVENADLKEEEKLLIIHRLHQVLRPFILRRLKSEVATQLPEKSEKVLKCELSAWQKVLYNQISSKVLAEKDLNSGF